MSTRIFTLLAFWFAFVYCLRTEAQPYIGLSADFGNPLSYSPGSKGLQRPLAISGSLLFNFRQELKNDWTLQYETGLGILAYNLKIISIDTLTSSEPYVFSEYSTFYGDLGLLAVKEIPIKNKKFMIGLGGGASYYYSPYPITTYNIDVVFDDHSEKKIFNAEINCPTNEVVAFATFAAQLQLTHSFIIRLQYSQHFSPVLSGFFEFHHTKPPSFGKISLQQRELSLALLVKITKNRE